MKRKWESPSGTRAYYAWRSMRTRCLNPKNPAWGNYGGRGISVCAEWINNYDAFYRDMGSPGRGESLDRIDVNLGYNPKNCRWATQKVQVNNKRTNRLITHNGVERTLTEWANVLGWSADTIYRRLTRMSVDRALSPNSLVPVRRCGTRQGYAKGCRCSECRANNAARAREARKKRALDAAAYSALAGEMATEGAA